MSEDRANTQAEMPEDDPEWSPIDQLRMTLLGIRAAAQAGDLERAFVIDNINKALSDIKPLDRLVRAIDKHDIPRLPGDDFGALIEAIDSQLTTDGETIRQLLKEHGDAEKWAAAYEREHGPFKTAPPDFMITF